MNELISVIVPIYNEESYLPRCIDSILKQTYKNIEVILINDGSTDKSGIICDVYGKKDSRVKVFHQENKGSAATRNSGVFYAKGSYVCFIDSDDFISDNMIERLYKLINDNNCDIAQCESESFLDIQKIKLNNSESYTLKVLDTTAALKKLITENKPSNVVIWNKLYKSEIIFNIPLTENKYIDDEFVVYKWLAAAKKIAYTNEKLHFCFENEKSISNAKYSLKKLDAVDAIMERHYFIEKEFPELSAYSKKSLWTVCLYSLQMGKMNLNNKDYSTAIVKIKNVLLKQPLNAEDKKVFSAKYKFWLLLFKKFPKFTIFVRNALNIGL